MVDRIVIIKNTKVTDDYWLGRLIAASSSYQLETKERDKWKYDTKVLADIVSGDIVINDGASDLTAIQGELWLTIDFLLEPATVEINIGSGSTTTTLAATVAPTIATGIEICTLDITPASTTNEISLNWHILGDSSTDRSPIIMVFRDSTLLIIDAITAFKRGYFGSCSGTFVDKPVTTSSITYSMRIVSVVSGVAYWGQNFSGDDFGGAATTGQKLTAIEIVIG